ncbi:putative RNA-directed DNA polymerase [Helianthus annuus]|nr:putative RNA-directed DNA polymerase [Helianthus annuus]
MTFLVQNLPDRTSKMLLWRAFQPHGFVTDAYVARKKDKRGNSFGFIRYVGVENVDATLADMNTVKILEAKVSVSLAKYDKNHKRFIYTSKVVGEKTWKPKVPTQTNQPNSGGAFFGGATVKEGQSFASLFQDNSHVTNMGSKTISVDSNGSKYPLHCIGRSIHGIAKNLSTLSNLHHILMDGGLDNYGLSYVGGLSVLLTLGNPEIVKDIMSNHSDCLSNVFSRFHVWNGEDLPMERVVSLRITGVPVHLRDNSLFDQIGGLFGKVVQESPFSWLESDNSDSSVMVLAPLGKRIEETVVADAFNQFILAAALHEYNMGGGRFTYISDNGTKLSKLDRFLVCLGFLERWPNASVLALNRDISDHRPIILNTTPADFGHTPFRFYNSWLEINGFQEHVTQLCLAFSFSGPPDLRLAVKLRWLKNKIKDWLALEKQRTEGVYLAKKKLIGDLEHIAESRPLRQEELDTRTECIQFVLEMERLKQMDVRQKSRSRWALEGDENSSFFHSVVNSNLSNNRINGIYDNGGWISNPGEIKENFFDFFSKQFTEPWEVRPQLTCPNLVSISDGEAEHLIAPFSLIEIKDAVWDCDGDRAPGPDGFNFKFIKRFWEGFQNDFIALFNKFYADGTLNSCCTSSFLALIPKVKDPASPMDFRPISLIGVINKVISKVLVNRLKGIMGKIISEEQSAFLAGRNIMDGPLILNEIVSWLKVKKKVGMIFKVDINKAYDSLSWKFLDSIMEQMNFPARWRKWISTTLNTARASVLVNGSPTMEFECTRGLRQGDPLSPFLFVIAMEALTGVMKQATMVNLFKGIKCTNDGPVISHFLYADDVIFLGEWSTENASNLRRILRCFYLASGLKVNLAKSSVYGVGINQHEVQSMATFLGCKSGSFPFKHLGLVVGANMNLVKNWKPIIDLFKNRLAIWKAKQLSYGGRVTLLKSVLNALPTYFFSLYKAPNQVIDALDRLRRVFFWGGSEEKAKMNWVAWDNVIAPIEYGGLGFGSLKDANHAMLAKWWWRFKVENKGLWRRVIWAIHHNSRSWSAIPAKISMPGIWKQIVNIHHSLQQKGIDLFKAIRNVVGNGSNTLFWLDLWIGNTPFHIRFPTLFSLERLKMCYVSDRIIRVGGGLHTSWDWTRPFEQDQEIAEFSELTDLLISVSISENQDVLRWGLDTSAVFSVRSVKSVLKICNRLQPHYSFVWNKWVPKKVGFVAWRAEKERLPTRMALAQRNIQVNSDRCAICGDYAETSEHLFVSCHLAQTVWALITQWCKIPVFFAFGIKDILDLHLFVKSSTKKKKIIQAIVHVTFWSIWAARNKLIFDGSYPEVSKILEEVKVMSYLWVKNRSKDAAITLESWKRFDDFG